MHEKDLGPGPWHGASLVSDERQCGQSGVARYLCAEIGTQQSCGTIVCGVQGC